MLYRPFQLFFFLIWFGLIQCQRNPVPQTNALPVQEIVTDSIPNSIFPAVNAPSRSVYTSEQLTKEMLHYKSLHFIPLCLKDTSTVDPETGTLRMWCVTCDGKTEARFKETEPDQETTESLQIEQYKISVDTMTFQDLGGFMDTVGLYLYDMGCDGMEKFIIGQDTFLNFSAGFQMCNGSGCGQGFTFLFHFNEKKLYAFDFYRGAGYFGDANGDKIIDYMEILPKDAWLSLDTISASFYTLDPQKKKFVTLKNQQGQPAVVWLRTPEDDYRDAKKFTIIKSPE